MIFSNNSLALVPREMMHSFDQSVCNSDPTNL